MYQMDAKQILILMLALLLTLAGCTTLKDSKIEEVKPPLVPILLPAEETEYVLQPGDVITVTFFYFPHLNTTVKIRPDGYISIAPIDDVKTAGLTTRELDELLTKRYTGRIENPELTVVLKEFAGQKIYVGGEVKNGGVLDYELNITALQAIFKAGGKLNTGNLGSVIIFRKKKDGTAQIFNINLGVDSDSKRIINDVYLRPLDVVYVPQTQIAQVNEYVDQYIRKLIPISMNAGFSYILGDSSVNLR